MLMRRGIPVAGNFLQQEVALATGAVELMIIDLQCIMASLPQVASHFHTKIVSTSSRANFPGSEYIEFDEKEGLDIAKKIVKIGVENFSNRKPEKVKIPNEKVDFIAGFTTENINYHLGGSFRGSYRPLNDAIISGRLRGVVGAVGCDNPKFKSGTSHIEMVKELLKYDVLFVETGCVAIACAKEGLLKPEAIYEKFVGDGLREVCEAVGIPPILHTGSCVDNSRILIECCKMVEEGGIGNSLDELPVAGVALEWMSEKAIAIGWYAVSSGLMVLFGSPFFTLGSKNVTKFVTEEIEGITGGKWAFEEDPIKAAHIIIEHLDKKRNALKLKPMMYQPKI